MAGGGSKPGERRGGRQKGTPNKTTKVAKDAIAAAADELGGVARLVEWVREDKQNERIFWGTIYPKLLPGGSGLELEFTKPIWVRQGAPQVTLYLTTARTSEGFVSWGLFSL